MGDEGVVTGAGVAERAGVHVHHLALVGIGDDGAGVLVAGAEVAGGAAQVGVQDRDVGVGVAAGGPLGAEVRVNGGVDEGFEVRADAAEV